MQKDIFNQDTKQFNNMFHLSHTDLDGYGAQIVTLKTFGENCMRFFNSNYGKKIDENFELIYKDITKDDMLLITDLNLTMEQATAVDTKSKEIGFTLLLIDHHGTGKPAAEKFEWYNLDTTKCATMLTLEYFKTMNSDLKDIVHLINVNDMWIEEDEHFDKARAFSQSLFDNKGIFPKALAAEENLYMLNLMFEVGKKFVQYKFIYDVEEQIYVIKRNLFDNDRNMPLHIAITKYLLPIIEKREDLYTEITINGVKGVLFFGIDGQFQEFSHMYMKKHGTEFVMNVSDRATVSLRALKEETHVDKMCQKFFNGGGHPCASGGFLADIDTRRNKLTAEEAFNHVKGLIA